jgi:ORF6N domain
MENSKTIQSIQNCIFTIRNERVMLDFDLAEMYEVENRALKQAVKRNLDRFPVDFMFKLTPEEWSEVITICDNLQAGAKFSPTTPFAFTEQGVSMLSSVLKSKKALQVNIAIMRTFVFMRQYALTHKDLTDRLTELERIYNQQFTDIYEAINFLLQKDQQKTEQKERKRVGYK